MKTVEQLMSELGFEYTNFENVMIRKTDEVTYYAMITEDEEQVTIVEVQAWEFGDLEDWELDFAIEMLDWSYGITLTQYLMRVK